jgi:hypothetical protein
MGAPRVLCCFAKSFSIAHLSSPVAAKICSVRQKNCKLKGTSSQYEDYSPGSLHSDPKKASKGRVLRAEGPGVMWRSVEEGRRRKKKEERSKY